MSGMKVATEVAEAEFVRFVDAMDLDLDPKGLDDEDRKSLEAAKRTILRAVERGHLSFNEKGEPVYSPQVGDTNDITFYEPTGASYMATDQKKTGHHVAKSFMAMADISRQDAKRFAKMANRDLKVCQAITALFLG